MTTPPRPRMKKRTFHEAGRTLTLLDRGTHHELLIGDVPILTSAALGTERGFGRLAGRFVVSPRPRIVIGGLGFGSTLAGALEVLPKEAEVIVVERLATVVRLVRGELAHLATKGPEPGGPGALDDPRVRVVREDVARVIARERGLDAILLDVDNGPEWASFEENARLYDDEGLRNAARALVPGGAYAVWSGYPVDAFLDRLRAAGLAPSVVEFEEKGRVQARAYVGVTPRRG